MMMIMMMMMLRQISFDLNVQI